MCGTAAVQRSDIPAIPGSFDLIRDVRSGVESRVLFRKRTMLSAGERGKPDGFPHVSTSILERT